MNIKAQYMSIEVQLVIYCLASGNQTSASDIEFQTAAVKVESEIINAQPASIEVQLVTYEYLASSYRSLANGYQS